MRYLQADRYTRLVTWLKVIFPLTALALLSTLFMLSGATELAPVPFADKDIQDRLRDQQITGPYFSGSSANGDQISFSAEKLTNPNGETTGNEAENVHAEVIQSDGGSIIVDADIAKFNVADDEAQLKGRVIISTSSGYRLESEHLVSKLSKLRLTSPGPVKGTGLGGTLNAGQMEITASDTDENSQLIFTNGVKLIYTPPDISE